MARVGFLLTKGDGAQSCMNSVHLGDFTNLLGTLFAVCQLD